MKPKLLILLLLITLLAGCHKPTEAEQWANLTAKFEIAVQTMVVQNQIIQEQRAKIKKLEVERETKCPTYTMYTQTK